jgi:hypothetical protein
MDTIQMWVWFGIGLVCIIAYPLVSLLYIALKCKMQEIRDKVGH